MPPQPPRVAVLVVGDLGRSPRMLYHAQSLAAMGAHVDLIGYADTPLPDTIAEHSNIRVVPIGNVNCFAPSSQPWLFPLFAAFKALVLFINLSWILLYKIEAPTHILVQNPPSVPALIVAGWASSIRASKLIIDWHNLGHSILALKLGQHIRLVGLYKWLEQHYGTNAYAHLFVTNAMEQYLSREWGLRGQKTVLYDRPPLHFTRLESKQRTQFLKDLAKDAASNFGLLAEFDPKQDALIVSSTSWTEDEDFRILLDALTQIEAQLNIKRKGFSGRLYMVITGKGPMRAFYESEIQKRNFSMIFVITGWLRAEDYPRILGSADIGVSLHTSSSGLDLPMKVVDMFGCGLPVCAVKFNCLSELINDRNGTMFTSPDELAAQILDFLDHPKKREALIKYIQSYFEKHRWDTEWQANAQPLFM